MLAARLVQRFDFSEPGVSRRLKFGDDDWKVGGPATPERVDIIDLDGKIRSIVHPGNGSDSGELSPLRTSDLGKLMPNLAGPPGMTAANVPRNDFSCKLTPRTL
jgi:hypothetical protein